MPKVTHITDENGSVVATREYDAFGNILSETGSEQWALSRHGYHPNWIELKDSDGRLYLAPGGRIYDAETGRFLQREPSKALAGDYKFARQNPNLYVDPDGRMEARIPERPVQPRPPVQPEEPTQPRPRPRIDMERLKKQLKKDEGYKECRYKDTEGKWTIGIGHNLEGGSDKNVQSATGKGTSEYRDKDTRMKPKEIDKLFDLDVQDAVKDAKKVIKNFDEVPAKAKEISVEMLFQVGKEGLAGHKKMIKALENRNWKKAAAEIRDSRRWRTQTRARAEDQAKRMESIPADQPAQEQTQPRPAPSDNRPKPPEAPGDDQ